MPLIASPALKGQPKTVCVAKLAFIGLIAVVSWVAIPAVALSRASVPLEGATISLQPPSTMAQTLLADVIPVKDDEHLLLLSIDLEEGWKTYWRLPGRFGLAPEFDWQASENVAAVSIHFPQPVLFNESGGVSIGYDAPTLWPIVVQVEASQAPTVVRLSFSIGLCAELCIPEHIELTVPLFNPSMAANIALDRVFTLRSDIEVAERSMDEVITVQQDTQTSVALPEFAQGSFVILEDEDGNHALLQPDNGDSNPQTLNGKWRWQTPISMITVVEPGRPTTVFSENHPDNGL